MFFTFSLRKMEGFHLAGKRCLWYYVTNPIKPLVEGHYIVVDTESVSGIANQILPRGKKKRKKKAAVIQFQIIKAASITWAEGTEHARISSSMLSSIWPHLASHLTSIAITGDSAMKQVRQIQIVKACVVMADDVLSKTNNDLSLQTHPVKYSIQHLSRNCRIFHWLCST